MGREYLDLPKMQGVLDSLKIRITPENYLAMSGDAVARVNGGTFLIAV